ncbi:hypothetical protein [Schaedlerella arabinosiphila]|nr:hypothetical protein [Schaedlerella arabinosiphila]
MRIKVRICYHSYLLTKRVLSLQAQGKSEQEIIAECGITAEEVREILA